MLNSKYININTFIRTFVYSLLLLPLHVFTVHAADAPDVDQSVVSMEDTNADQYNMTAPSNTTSQNNFYIGLSVNMFAGDATQVAPHSWEPQYNDQPIWYEENVALGASFGRYFNTTTSSRLAVEGGYITKFETEDNPGGNVNLVVDYIDIFTLDLLYLQKLTDNLEFFGSVGVGSMEIRGGQYFSADNRASAREDFSTYGAGILYKYNSNYDIKLTIKHLTDAETDSLDIGPTFSDRALGFEDAYLASASILYNF